MKKKFSIHSIALCTFACIVFLPMIASAQIALDGTLKKDNPGLIFEGSDIEIPSELGIINKGNLFHSFERFNINNGESATFTLSAGDTGVGNVISRVTGGEISSIDGVLRSKIPNASFWFLNPAGVVFGPNAQLDIDGSFSTGAADFIRFADDKDLSASTGLKQILELANPFEFGFFESSTATLTVNGSQLSLGKGVSLSGTNVEIKEGIKGDIQVATKISPGLTPDSKVVQGGNIGLSAKNTLTISDSLIETNENGLGSIILIGEDIEVTGSDIQASIDTVEFGAASGDTPVLTNLTTEFGKAGDIAIKAENSTKLSNTRILTQTAGERGNGGDITIESPQLEVLKSSRIATTTTNFESGRGGNISIVSAQSVSLSGTPGGADSSTIETISAGGLHGGDISIQTPILNLDAESLILSETRSYGTGGDISLSALDNFSLSGGNVQSKVLETAPGQGGNIHIGFIEDTETYATSVTVAGGATVLSSTQYVDPCGGECGGGEGGDITIEADESIDLSSANVTSETTGTAPGGQVDVDAPSVSIQEQTELLSSTSRFAESEGSDDNFYGPYGGPGGDILVNAENEFVISDSGIESQTTGDGAGGEVEIRSPDVLLENQSSVNSGTAGHADGGDIDIEPCSECAAENFRFHIKDESLIKVEGNEEYAGIINIFRVGSFGGEVLAGDVIFGTPLDPLADATEEFIFGPGGIELDARYQLEESPVPPSGPNYVITEKMGVLDDKLGNLFHFFTQFNLTSGETATFTGGEGIANVISQVTGDNASSIDGAIISQIPGANFFFINRNGVFFGPNATISTTGAFVAAASQPLNFPEPFDENQSGQSASLNVLRVAGAGFFGDPTGPVRISSSQLENSGLLAIAGTEVQIIGGAELTGESVDEAGAIDIYASKLFTLSDSELDGNEAEFGETSSTITALAISESPSAVRVRAPVVQLLNEAEISSQDGVHIQYTGTTGSASQFTIQEGSTLEAGSSVAVSGFDTVQAVPLVLSPAVVEPPEPPPCPEGCEGNPDEKAVQTVEAIEEDINFALDINVFDQTYNHIKTACKVRQPGGEKGGFRVVKRRGMPASPEELLMAYHPGIMNADPALQVAALPPGTQPALAEQFDADAPQTASARALTEGTRAFRGGNYEKAGQEWAKASKLYASLGNQAARGDALRKLAETQQIQGNFAESVGTLQEALKIAKGTKDKVQVASLLTSMGNANIALGDSKTAKKLLTRGLKLAEQTKQPALVTTSLNNLGNLYSTEGEYKRAIEIYERSAKAAKASNQNVQFVKALSNGARAALKAGRRDSVRQLLDGAFKWAGSLEDSSEKATILIHLAKSYEQLADTSRQHKRHGYLKSYESLMAAYRVAKSQDEFRVRSFALGNLAHLYMKRGRLAEALYVTRVALNSAKTANAPESVYRWLWQEGQILWAMGKRGPALRSYRRAVRILEDTRQESLAQYGSSSAHFHKVVSPVYMDLVDALVQASAIMKEPAKAQLFLVEARDTLEKFRASELREYFRDECFGEFEYKTVNLEGVSDKAAVIYPILFADRVDLLVSVHGEIRRFTSPVGKKNITREIHKFRQYVEMGDEAFAGSSRNLYDWLIRPYEKDLLKADMDTLVFVPDGPLRSVPMSALNDGDEFLVQKFAVAVTPSLTMTQPQPLDRDNVQLLLAGLSEAVQDFSALDSVPQEVANIKNIYGGDLLMNKTFTVNNFGSALKDKEMSIVHIASHGSFTGRESENFLLAYDGKIHMDKLRSFIGSTRTRENPIELLVLSACETAAGDDRAALGLAGVAIQAGARSAMGSLWKISDQGTTELIAEFYQQLKNPNLNKAQALQQAQKKLLASKEFRHPFFWSPFLMINNWL